MKLTNQDRIRLHQAWWAHTNEVPLALIYMPSLPPPTGESAPAATIPAQRRGLDIDLPPEELVLRKLAGIEAQYRVPKETLVVARTNFATALIPAMLGAGFEYNEHTSWAIPTASSIRGVRITRFDPQQPLFRAYIERQAALLAHWSWDTYLPANEAYLGPLDLLAGLLGPQQLCMDLFDHPDHVKGKALEAAHFLIDMVNYELALFRKAGFTDGTPCAFSYWLPGSGFLFSEDFCALVSRKHYAEFFLEADIAFCRAVDSAFLHVHSAGAQCLPAILDNPYLRGVELANDAGNRDIRVVVDGAKLVQARRLPMQVSSWEHPLEDWEMRLVLDELDPHGLLVAFQARTIEEAHDLYRLTKGVPWE
jgi:hypothetical protein